MAQQGQQTHGPTSGQIPPTWQSYMYTLSMCLCVGMCTCLGACGGQKRQITLELELQVTVIRRHLI